MLRLLMQDEEDATEVRVPEVRLTTDPLTLGCDVDWMKIKASSSAVRKVVQWCEHYEYEPRTQSAELTLVNHQNPKKSTKISEWEQAFFTVNQELLFEIILVCSKSGIQILHATAT